jgi:hypothetical protein
VTRALRSVWEFVVGEDWRVAAGVAAAFGLSAGLVDGRVPAWWALPLVVAIVLAGSLLAAARGGR